MKIANKSHNETQSNPISPQTLESNHSTKNQKPEWVEQENEKFDHPKEQNKNRNMMEKKNARK